MKLFNTILCFMVSQSLAAPFAAHWARPDHCISDDDATLIATEFGYTVSNPSVALATQLFANNFTDQSDSIIQLANAKPGTDIPLGSVIFPSKAAFIAASQAPIPFEPLNIWHTCNTVIVRWLSTQTPNQVQGISILTVEHALPGEGGGFGVGEQKYQIYKVYVEFNSGAFLENLASTT